MYMCMCVNVAYFEALSGLATWYIVCFSVLNEINCIVEVGVVL